jgi:hypothetical protein
VTRLAAGLLAASLVLAAGCGPPIHAYRTDAQTAHRKLTATVLTTGDLSRRTRNLLYDRDLIERYDEDPEGALGELHAQLVAGTIRSHDADRLAELAFHHAQHGGGRPYALAAALYAWAYLFPEDPAQEPNRYDPRLRLACDLYNLGISKGFESEDGKSVTLTTGSHPLPFGTLEVSARQDLRWGEYELDDFVPIGELAVEGFPTYYRWPGLGAPLAARARAIDPEKRGLLAPRARVPVTVIVRPDDVHAGLRTGTVPAAIEGYAGFGEGSVRVGDQKIPLEAEPTAALGYALTGAPVWKTEYAGFLRGFGIIQEKTRLVGLRPYRPGLIPVVFVHGTASSAARWAQMYNDLDNDPRIHDHYQFWFFSYETGNPIAYSSMLLRDALADAVARLDPEGKDPALRRMVLIGHSQGGLLTKMQVVDPGSKFWDNVSDSPIDKLGFSEATLKRVRGALFFDHSPYIQRVVFVATPQHGSYVAGNWLAHQVARFVRAPLDVTRAFTEFASAGRTALKLRGAPTAVDNMTPGNPFVKTLASLPIVPGVHAHSIIAAEDPSDLKKATDGVVAYESAHIDGVDSEVIVKSAHSCQSNPHTINEVRRILLLHLGAQAPGAEPAPPR